MGATKIRILEALVSGQEFGYGLWKTLRKEGGITTASVYQHLAELEGGALVRRSRVTTAKGRERIYYELTRKGAEMLNRIRKSASDDGVVLV